MNPKNRQFMPYSMKSAIHSMERAFFLPAVRYSAPGRPCWPVSIFFVFFNRMSVELIGLVAKQWSNVCVEKKKNIEKIS